MSRNRYDCEAGGIEAKEAMMPEFGDFMDLFKEGKIEEALALVEAKKVKFKYAPDKISVVKGTARFTKRGKPVEQGEDGNWRLKPKTVTSRKGQAS